MIKLKIIGKTVEISQGQNTGSCEYAINHPLNLEGFIIFCENPVFGDEIKVEIVDVNDETVNVFLENIKLTSKINAYSYMAGIHDTTGCLCEGMKLIFTYIAIDNNGRQCNIHYRLSD